MTFAHLDAVLAEASPIAERFVAAGHTAFLVGGVVRDLWLDVPLDADTDLDLTTDARPGRIKELLAGLVDALWTQGERFGTIGCVVDGRVWEITTHRSEVYDPSSRKPQVHYADRIDADLSRRDFTVNAMAVALPGGELVDPFGGADHLRERRLCTPLSPAVSFGDDPLRMLRAARFAATHLLVADEEVEAAMVAMAGRLDIVSAERIRLELDKLLQARDPRPGLALARRTGVLAHVVPELAELPADQWLAALDAISRVSARLEVRLAVLLLFVADEVRSHRLAALRHPRRVTEDAVRLARGVEALLASPPGSDGALRRAVAASSDRWEPILDLAVTVAPGEQRAALVAAQRRAAELGADLHALGTPAELPLGGRQVIDLLGVPSGRVVGEALAVLRRHRLEHGPLDRDTAVELLERWWATEGGGGARNGAVGPEGEDPSAPQ